MWPLTGEWAPVRRFLSNYFDFLFNFAQTITAIYDKACICAKGRYFEHLGLNQMFVEISSKGLYFYITQLPIRLNCSG